MGQLICGNNYYSNDDTTDTYNDLICTSRDYTELNGFPSLVFDHHIIYTSSDAQMKSIPKICKGEIIHEYCSRVVRDLITDSISVRCRSLSW